MGLIAWSQRGRTARNTRQTAKLMADMVQLQQTGRTVNGEREHQAEGRHPLLQPTVRGMLAEHKRRKASR